MGKLRHVALVVRDIEKSAQFYEKVFGMKRVGRDDLEIGSGIYLSDGVVNLALLSGTVGKEKIYGTNHFGFIVDDLEACEQTIDEAGGVFFFDLGKGKDDVNFEKKFKDPDGIVFDISEKGWQGTSAEK